MRERIRATFGKWGWDNLEAWKAGIKSLDFIHWPWGTSEALEKRGVFQEKPCGSGSQGRNLGEETRVAQTSHAAMRVVQAW